MWLCGRSPNLQTFMTNEADTPKILMAFQEGAWLDSLRYNASLRVRTGLHVCDGDDGPSQRSDTDFVGVDPVIAEYVPALFEYIANTALANDTFFAGCRSRPAPRVETA